jgi:Tfp pilus assembly protein PilE
MKTTKQQENGRSMTELLGVLAIIGVLSVGGIAGFKTAIDKHKSNELLQSALMRASVISPKILSGKIPTASEFSNLKNDSAVFDESIETNIGNRFGIKVSKVKESVCKNILNMKNNIIFIARQVSVTGLTELKTSDCSGEDNSFYFVFNNNLTPFSQMCTTNNDCISGQTCQNGKCVCKNGKVEAIDGWSVEFAPKKMCCSPEMVINGYCCRTIIENDDGTKSCCMSPNSTCCPAGSFWSDYDNACHSCDEAGDIQMQNANSSAACRFCPNRVALFNFCRTECPNPEMILVDRYCTCPLEKPYMYISTDECFSLDELKINKSYQINNRYKKGKNSEWLYDDSLENIASFLKDNPHYYYSGGGMTKCAEDRIGVSGCKTCDQVDLTTIKFQSQCKFCDGTWDGENWFTGTCSE